MLDFFEARDVTQNGAPFRGFVFHDRRADMADIADAEPGAWDRTCPRCGVIHGTPDRNVCPSCRREDVNAAQRRRYARVGPTQRPAYFRAYDQTEARRAYKRDWMRRKRAAGGTA